MPRLLSCILTVTVALLLASSASAGVLTWDGGGDGVSLFQEANWDLDGLGDPPAGTVDGAKTVNHDMVVTSGTPGGGGGAGNHLDMGANGSLTMSAGTFRMSSGKGIRNSGGGDAAGQPSALLTGGTLLSQFFADTAVTLGGSATVTLFGGGDPVAASTTIDFTSSSATLNFNNETAAAFQSEHLGKITVNGSPALMNTNLQAVAFNGTSGSQVTRIGTTLTWNGLGDAVSFADEANWTGTASTSGTVQLATLVDDYLIDLSSATVGGSGAVGDMVFKGGTLTVLDGALSGLTKGLTGGVVEILGGSVERQFLLNSEVHLGGTGELYLNGGGVPINNSTIDLASFDSALYLLNETNVDFLAEHLAKITIFGQPAVLGDNLTILSYNNGLGTLVKAQVPEPTSLVLAGLALLGLAMIRLRRRR